MKRHLEDVEIVSSAAGTSGLRLTNLPSGTAQSTFNGILGINASGDVIKIDATKIATVTVGAVAPTSPVVGQQWLDTSVSPNELNVRNGTTWTLSDNEVQEFANLAAFPATGLNGVVYLAEDTDTAYTWDATTSTYVTSTGSGGLFSITDGTNTESIAVGNIITFNENAAISGVLNVAISATDTVQLQAVAGHTNGQAMVSNGTVFSYQSVGRKFATTITPVANTAQTVTHNLGTTDIIVQVYDITLNELVSVEVVNRTTNSVDIISTTTDQLRIIVLG